MPLFRMFPFNEVKKNANVAIYGSGVIFEEFLSQINALNYCNICWVIDKKISETYTDNSKGILFCSPDEMNWELPEYIIIASIEYAAEIEGEILNRKGNLDTVIRVTKDHIVKLKTDYKDDIVQQQRKLFECGNIYNKRDPSLIVSLTSMASRINSVHLVVESLIQQSTRADKVVLWLGEDVLVDGKINKANLPTELLKMIPKGLEIRPCKDIRSYKKLLPALDEFSGSIIVTADDDILYPSDWLEKLFIAYQKEPELIHCHRGHLMSINQYGTIQPYSEWKTGASVYGYASDLIFPIGCGGVLYPPNSLHEDVMDIDMAISLSPTGDDIWFKAMSLKNNLKSKVLLNGMKELNYVFGTQDFSLWKHNLQKDKNDLVPNDYQIRAVFEHYNLLGNLVK